MTRNKLRALAPISLVALAAAVLTACGGGKVVDNYGVVDVKVGTAPASTSAGTVVQITGEAVTASTKLSTMSWNVATPAGAQVPVINNGDCTVGTRDTTVIDPAQNTNSPATGSSSWNCALSITAPQTITSDVVYQATFTATDERGTTNSKTTAVKFTATTGSVAGLVANAGGAFTVSTGSTGSMHCGATGGKSPYAYTWSITDNGGKNVVLSSYSAADTTFVAPNEAANLAFACTVTDAAGAKAVTTVNASVTTAAAKPVTVNAGTSYSVAPGDKAPLQCDATGTTGTVTYRWSVADNAGLAITLASLNSDSTSFVAPAVTAATTVQLKCSVSDSANGAGSALVAVTINPASASSALTANAGQAFNLTSGAQAALHCDAFGGKGPYSYQWLITANGGLPLSLSAYNAADTTFTAPAVAVDTPVTFTCRATDSTSTVATSAVSPTIKPSAVSSSVPTLVAKIVNSTLLSPGQVVQADSTGTGWFDANGKSSTGPVITYAWSSTDTTITFSDPASATPTFVVPNNISAVTKIPVTLTTSAAGYTSTASTVYVVDPSGPLQLSVNPPAASGVAGAYTFTATPTFSGSSRTLYYQWTQVSGLTIPLGGASTASLGVAPTAAGTYVFRVAIGYEAITALKPGVYFSDVVLTITP